MTASIPPEAQQGNLSLGGPAWCDQCDERLHEHTAGLGPNEVALLCPGCLAEAWDADARAELAAVQADARRRELLSEAYEAEKREEAAAALATDMRKLGQAEFAALFDAQRRVFAMRAAALRLSAMGAGLVASTCGEQEQQQQGAAE